MCTPNFQTFFARECYLQCILLFLDPHSSFCSLLCLSRAFLLLGIRLTDNAIYSKHLSIEDISIGCKYPYRDWARQHWISVKCWLVLVSMHHKLIHTLLARRKSELTRIRDLYIRYWLQASKQLGYISTRFPCSSFTPGTFGLSFLGDEEVHDLIGLTTDHHRWAITATNWKLWDWKQILTKYPHLITTKSVVFDPSPQGDLDVWKVVLHEFFKWKDVMAPRDLKRKCISIS